MYTTRQCDVTPYIAAEQEVTEEISGFRIDIKKAIIQAKAEAPPSTAKGIEAMCLMAEGYTSSEIGKKMNASAKLVCAWVSKARKFLKERPEMMQIKEAYHSGI